MSIINCKMCGGSLREIDDSGIAVCEYCGTKQTISKTSDDVISNLYNRANNLRLKNEFDKASNIYEKIVEQNDSEAEAHWGLVLCKYGIEYVDDPYTGKKIPTCHRTSFDSIKSDIDYQAAIDYSSYSQQLLYEEEAREIDRLQRDILNIAKNEKPFDVFICYKETDENGKRTLDSVIANDIYYQLTQEGFKVFFAAITLENKLGQEYEPYIFAALNSAKVMMVLGTKPEYFNAVWVKNEWSRYLSLMKKDRSKILIPCYRDMDAYDLPEEFAYLQAQDMSKIGFISDVIRGINKILNREEIKEESSLVEKTTGSVFNTGATLKRAFIFLEDRDFDSADVYLNRVLDNDPENGEAYFGKLLIDYNLTSKNDLFRIKEDFSNNRNYIRAKKYSNETFRKEIDDIYNKWLAVSKENQLFIQNCKQYKKLLEFAVKNQNYEVINKIAQYAKEKPDIGGSELFDIVSEEKNLILNRIIAAEEYINKSFSENNNRYFHQTNLEMLKKNLESENDNLGFLQTKRKNEIESKLSLISEAEVYQEQKKKIDLLKEELNKIETALNSKAETTSVNPYDLYKSIQIGDVVYFGTYENRKEDYHFKWRVIDKKKNELLLLMDCCLKEIPFSNERSKITWENSSLRIWLNSVFLEEAFSENETELIKQTNVKCKYDQIEETEDFLFLLSDDETEQYLPVQDDRIAFPLIKNNAVGWWWLRTVDHKTDSVLFIDSIGRIRKEGRSANDTTVFARPAMWISFE